MPQDWWELLEGYHAEEMHFRNYTSAVHAFEAAAITFAKLPPKRRAALLTVTESLSTAPKRKPKPKKPKGKK